ncbi:MAG: Gfo/Idh/MocA family oxidoreductase [Gemmataceae bacterium]|nr:Gfo/Idh/MocA family oxidoreductase [Gemmataceae bacterium]
MIYSTLSRRGFLERSLGALAATGLPLWNCKELAAQETGKKEDAKGPIMGAIGIGSPKSRGNAIYNDARRVGGRYVAACNVESNHLASAVAMMKEHGSPDVKGYKDYRELLDRKDIEAVTIATPDHWHALVAIEALRKGKDVYCEKPLTLTVEEALAVMKAAEKSGRTFQTGSQQRSDNRFRLACELVRNGRIGKIKQVECRIGGNPVSGKIVKAAPPETLDWNLWLGPTPMVDYLYETRGEKSNKKGASAPQEFTNCHYEFRWFYEFSGGKMTDWGAHHLDIAQWGLGTDGTGPVMVHGEGAKPHQGINGYNCHPTFKVTYTYASGAKVLATHGTLPDTVGDKDGNGILFVGEDNQWIFVNRGKITASDAKLLEEPLNPDATRLEVSKNHMGNFMECRSTGKKPICNASIGGGSVIVCHIGAIALRLGKTLKWDPKTSRFDDSKANAMLSRPMRSPWKLEV